MSDDKFRLEILEVLYKQGRKCSAGVNEEFLIQKLKKFNIDGLKVHVDYLAEKEYILIKPVNDCFITVRKISITSKGTDLVENPQL